MIDYACVYGGFCPSRPPAPQASGDHNFRGLYINLDANLYLTGRVLYTGTGTSNVVGNVDLIDSSGRVRDVVRVILTPTTLYDGQTADYAIQLPTWVSKVRLRNFNHNPLQSKPAERRTQRQCVNTALNQVWDDIHCQFNNGMFEWRTIYLD